MALIPVLCLLLGATTAPALEGAPGLDLSRWGGGEWGMAAALIVATFVSEDLTCIAAGLLIHRGQLPAALGVAACTAGIALGDMGLWLLGRALGHGLRWAQRWRGGRLSGERLQHASVWLDRHMAAAILTARCLPGARLPTYVAAGMLGRRVGRFFLWAMLAALVWTPTLVLLVAWQGQRVITPMERYLGGGWWSLLLSAAVVLLALRLLMAMMTPIGRARLWARVSRLWRWEFWPAWVFYGPLIPWIAYLCLRHGGLRAVTLANPCIPHGGLVGESKSDILTGLPADLVARFRRIDPAPGAAPGVTPGVARAAAFDAAMCDLALAYPVIMKPDAGQRGAGVRRITDRASALAYLDQQPAAVIVQAYHPGPYEAGVFYYRYPDAPHGHLFSITDKVFATLTGDGRSTLEELLWAHRRYRMQARTYLARLGPRADAIPAAGEVVPLGVAGNHCQGTLFRDGGHLLTPELEAVIDQAVRAKGDFYFGRFDVRYADPGELRHGRGFSIIELNGITSESTNLYDPDWSLLRAYRTLFAQWRILFEIGARQRRRGLRPAPWGRILADVRRFYRDRRGSLASD